MAYATKTAINISENQKKTATYSCKTSGIGYSVINENIKDDFNFLVKDIPQNLEAAMKSLESTKSKEAFSFSKSNSSRGEYEDLTLACAEIQRDVDALKSDLLSLYNDFIVDINNINSELEYDFGWAVAGEFQEESIQNENV